MIKVTYYVGTCDKDTCKKELSDRDFYKVFNELFDNYTLQEAQGVYTMRSTGTVVRESTFILITFIDVHTVEELKQYIHHNCNILKHKLNQESILVEATKPEVMYL